MNSLVQLSTSTARIIRTTARARMPLHRRLPGTRFALGLRQHDLWGRGAPANSEVGLWTPKSFRGFHVRLYSDRASVVHVSSLRLRVCFCSSFWESSPQMDAFR